MQKNKKDFFDILLTRNAKEKDARTTESIDELEKLANDEDFNVRANVVENPICPLELLEKLLYLSLVFSL